MIPTTESRFLANLTFDDAFEVMKINSLTTQMEQKRLLDIDFIPYHFKEKLVYAIRNNTDDKQEIIDMCYFIQSCGKDQKFFQLISANILRVSYEYIMRPQITVYPSLLTMTDASVAEYIRSMNQLSDIDIQMYVHIFAHNYKNGSLQTNNFIIEAFKPKQKVEFNPNISILSHSFRKMYASLYTIMLSQIVQICINKVVNNEQELENDNEMISNLKTLLQNHYNNLHVKINNNVVQETKNNPSKFYTSINQKDQENFYNEGDEEENDDDDNDDDDVSVITVVEQNNKTLNDFVTDNFENSNQDLEIEPYNHNLQFGPLNEKLQIEPCEHNPQIENSNQDFEIDPVKHTLQIESSNPNLKISLIKHNLDNEHNLRVDKSNNIDLVIEPYEQDSQIVVPKYNSKFENQSTNSIFGDLLPFSHFLKNNINDNIDNNHSENTSPITDIKYLFS